MKSEASNSPARAGGGRKAFKDGGSQKIGAVTPNKKTVAQSGVERKAKMTPPAQPARRAALSEKPSREEAEDAIRMLLRWAGDDPGREGLIDTPERVARAFEEWFSGYGQDPVAYLQRTFEEVEGYDEMVLLRDIRFESHCEHHLAPIIGKAHVAYLPNNKVVGISKLARVVETYARRLQVQEKMTAQIANAIQHVLEPKGVAVIVEAQHQCMTTRGVHKPGVTMVTSSMLGEFRTNALTRREFLTIVGNPVSTMEG